MTFKNILAALQENRVVYLIAGGIAVNLHGVERATADLDLIVELSKENIKKLVLAMSQLGFTPKVPVKAEDLGDPEKRQDWIVNKGMKVFSFINLKNSLELIDIFVEYPLPFDQLLKNVEKLQAFGMSLPVVSVQDLIEMKEAVGRQQDISDADALRKVLELREKESGE